jgi:hypothetical protein
MDSDAGMVEARSNSIVCGPFLDSIQNALYIEVLFIIQNGKL